MNVDNLKSKYKVVSKYFTGKTVMDESLTDFQEKKTFQVVRNNKESAVKPKVKKVKRAKGQKDIRTALKSKKNDLLAYSADFDSVCKKSGIDVDPEQLQLAIALSKSLQTEIVDNSTSSSKSLTAQQRSGLIRTTLKEYGFKVPEKPCIIKKPKKRRKPYKLLLTSDEEKRQIIADRYTQRIFELNSFKKPSSDKVFVKSNLLIYNMATNIEYDDIKDDSVLYVDGLIQESPNSMGSLLKKWSDIPGRPLSPQPNKSEIIFSEIECSQNEMDIILSGHLKHTNNVLKKKNLSKIREKNTNCNTVERYVHKTDTIVINNYDDNLHPSPEVSTVCSDSDDSMHSSRNSRLTVAMPKKQKTFIGITQPGRSLSPDIFDEEDNDTIGELPSVVMTESKVKSADNITKERSEVMDLTECVITVSQKNRDIIKNTEHVSQLLQSVDITKRRSNDFMEMTECVGSTSQPNWGKKYEPIETGQFDEIITATQTTGEVSTFAVNMDIVDVSGHTPPKIKKIIDLTAYCENNVKTNKNSDNNAATKGDEIDLTGNNENIIENEKKYSASADSIEHMDLTQSSDSSTDTLPVVHISGKPTLSNKSLEDTIIMDEEDYFQTKSTDIKKNINDSGSPKVNRIEETNTQGTITRISPKNNATETEEAPVISLDETCEIPAVDNDIDLTQSSDSMLESSAREFISRNSSLGKRDNVSVDYDEALENMHSFPYYTHDDNSTELMEKHSPTIDKTIISNDIQPVLTLLGEIKSLSRNENVYNHVDFGSISIIENLPTFDRKSRNTMNNLTSMSDSLPIVNVKGRASPEKLTSSVKEFLHPVIYSVSHESIRKDKPYITSPQTPQNKVNSINLNVETPEKSEYIVKTDNVTPMLDYASMSTPERNRELDKYGLKPFKRKRAIQLLTHLYNQTHPYVESEEELTSPSKKRKKDDLSKPTSSKSSTTSISPRSKSKSPRRKSPSKREISPRKRAGDSENLNESDKENDLFTVTSEVPAIRNVECDADDWVFQKREKAKLHSCRVPLHIAFHNYVSCRRRLHEAILRYEPVNIDVIHKELVASGHRYDPKDLLKFMDKKCITVKTADTAKNNKRY